MTGKGERNHFLLSQNICSLISMPRFCKALPAGAGSSIGNVEGYLRKCLPWTNDLSSPAWGRRWTEQHGGTRPSQRTMPDPKAPPCICAQRSSHVSLPSGPHTGANTYSGVIPPLCPFTEPSAQRRWDEPNYVRDGSLHAVFPIQTVWATQTMSYSFAKFSK